MSANTAFLNLYKPGGGSSGLIVPDEVVDVDRINGNMDLIDSFASSWGLASRQTRDFTGPAASLASIVAAAGGARLGDTYQETDGSKIFWRYDGTTWIGNEGGSFIIRPTAVGGTGASIAADGSVALSGATGNISVDGVFPARFDRVLMVLDFDTQSADAGHIFQIRVGSGTTWTTNTYFGHYFESSVSIAQAKNDQNGVNFFNGGRIAQNGGSSQTEFISPNKTVGTKSVFFRSQDSATYYRHGGGYVNTTNPLTGVYWQFGAITAINGRIRFIGLP